MGRQSLAFYIVLGAALFVFIRSYSLLSPIILAFILTFLIALAVNPIVSRLRTLTGGRRGATLIVTAVFVALLALTGWAFYIPIKTSASDLANRLPEYWERVQRPLMKFEKEAVLSEAKLRQEVTTEVAEEAAAAGEFSKAQRAVASQHQDANAANTSLRANILRMVQGTGTQLSSIVFNTAQIGLVLITVFFGVVFTLFNPRPLFRAVFYLVPPDRHPDALTVFQRIGAFVPNWALSTLLGMLSIGTLTFLIMWPIFGFFDALILGIIAFVLEAIPYLGPILSAVPGILLALGKGGMTPVWVALAYIVIQALENNVVAPLVMAKGMKLHPLAVMFSMLLCVVAFGVLGVLIAAPMVAIVQILYDELYRRKFLPGVTDDRVDELARSALYDQPTGTRVN